MNDEAFESIELLRLKYRRAEEIILIVRKICSRQKLGPPSVICRNIKALKKVLMNQAEMTEI